MRLFKSNKSQASIDRLTSSRDGSPTGIHSEAAYPQTPQPAVYSGALVEHADRFSQQPSEDSQYQDPQTQPRSVHIVHRTQSNRAPSAGEVYGARRPSVNIIPPLSSPGPVSNDPAPIPGQTTFGQSKTVRTEKEHRRSKRSIFGLPSFRDRDRDEERENAAAEAAQRKNVGRSNSVHLLRKTGLQATPQGPTDSQQAPSPFQTTRQSAYYGRPETSSDNLVSEQPRYEQYQTPQGQFDSPQSQTGHRQSPDFGEETGQYSPQQEQYQAYHQPASANTSEHYLPQQPPLGRPSVSVIEPHQSLRPSSQASLGPPSPLGHASVQENRPSTATTSRYSNQPVNQPLPPPPNMGRGDPPNGNLRQQLAQHRDPRSEEQAQYQSQQDPRGRLSQQASDQGRSTPPPRSKEDVDNLDYQQLKQRHEELQSKYSKVKRYYFEKENQVQQLQNTVANQRLSMSKTSLDDAQYADRFQRLNNAINNLSFNIRKNWRGVPPWLRHVCNQDAHTVGRNEMTAIGRACISRWLYESVFERTFHPGIDPNLSLHLKNIERSLRRRGPAVGVLTDEQRDDMITQITTWRLTTIEGLQDVLSSRQADQFRDGQTQYFTHQLTESLKVNLTDPPPPGLSEGVSMIIEQAIGIVSNLPLESREICIEYFMPGTLINETYMKLEPQITPLTNPGPDERMITPQIQNPPGPQQEPPEQGDGTSTASNEDRDRDLEADIREASARASQTPGSGQSPARNLDALKSGDKRDKKSSFLGGFVGKKPPAPGRGGPEQQGLSGPSGGGTADSSERGSMRENVVVDPANPALPGNNEGRIRFAAFLSVEVRGKGGGIAGSKDGNGGGGNAGSPMASNVNILFKAPVYEY